MKFPNPLSLVVMYLASSPISAQALEVRNPAYVVDVGSVIRSNSQDSYAHALDLKASGSRWAMLVSTRPLQGPMPRLFEVSPNARSMVISGDASSHWVQTIKGTADQITLSRNGDVYVKHKSASGDFSISVLNGHGGLKDTQRLNVENSSSLLLLDGRVLLKTENGVSEINAAIQRDRKETTQVVSGSDSEAAIRQVEVTFGLSGNRYAIFRTLTEDIRIFSAEGERLSRSQADLDAAYRSLGKAISRFAPDSDGQGGRSRVFWAAGGEDGYLYVCLSELNITREPIRLAVINPENGGLIKLLSFNLPRASVRVSNANPNGSILPTHGAVGDRILILDKELMLLTVY